MTNIPFINRLLKDKAFTTKIYIYMSTKLAGEDFDSYEQNYTYTNLNPIVLKGYVREINPETAFWKYRGLSESKLVEVIVELKYENYFRNANKIEIDDEEYEVFKSGGGFQTSIIKRPYNLLRVTLSKKS